MRNLSCSLIFVTALLGAFSMGLSTVEAQQKDTVLIGLDADMSSGTAEGGESIRRGASVAIREINEKGGVLGRKLDLIVRDHRGNPTRGVDNVLEFAEMKNLVAVLGGIHTPVALNELKTIHANKLIYLGPWAAGTPIIDNGFKPNYVFRVSVRDALAGGYMVNYSFRSGFKKIGLLFERTGWGRSNENAVNSALEKRGAEAVGLEWFNWGVTDLTREIDRLTDLGAEALILVANPREGGLAIKAMAARPENQRLPIISHWGISGGDFFHDNKAALEKTDFSFLQTFSFIRPPVPEMSARFYNSYQKSFPDTLKPEDVKSPVGAAHAYDLIHLLTRAISDAKTTERSQVRDALEQIKTHSGLMKTYSPPFTPDRHDALGADSFIMARYDENGVIRPVDTK